MPAPAAQAAPPEGSKRGTTEKISRMRSVIAKRMVESLQIAAQLTGTVEVDLTNISKLRARAKDDFKAREGASLSYLPFICKAVCEALKQFDKVNASIHQFLMQLLGVIIVAVYSFVVTIIIFKVISAWGPIRVTKEEEEAGLDESLHGEEAYKM